MEHTHTPVEEPGAGAAAPPATALRTAQRRRAAWLAGMLAIVAAIGCVAWLANVVSTERALHAVTSAALPPVAVADAVPPPAGAPGAPPDVTLATAGTAAIAAGALPPAPAPTMASTVASTAASTTTSTTTSTAAPATPAAVEPTPADVPAAQPPDRSARASKAVRTKTRRAAVRQAGKRKADSGTFRRCPPLGQAGAVMCRWHICNGGAGKEAVCRPYLEHRP